MTKKIAIIGAGPAGLSAAVSLASEGYEVDVYESGKVGGQAVQSGMIENCLGFYDGFDGPTFFADAEAQARKFGVNLLVGREYYVHEVTSELFLWSDAHRYETRPQYGAIIVATGLQPRRLDIPGDDLPFVHYSMSPSDEVRDKEILVIGGGNSAGQAVLHFLEQGAGHVVLLVKRSLKETMSHYLITRIQESFSRELLYGELQGIERNGEYGHATYRKYGTLGMDYIPVDDVYVFIGKRPTTGFLTSAVRLDENGYIVTDAHKTWVPGIFAIGDVVANSTKRMGSAMGDGCSVARTVIDWLA